MNFRQESSDSTTTTCTASNQLGIASGQNSITKTNKTSLNYQRHAHHHSVHYAHNHHILHHLPNNHQNSSNNLAGLINSSVNIKSPASLNGGKLRPTHQRTKSDTTSTNGLLSGNRSVSVASLKLTIGDLMSGRAFDNNCTCYEAQLARFYSQQESSSSSSSSSSSGGEEQFWNRQEKETTEQEDNRFTSLPPPTNLPNFECTCNAPRLAPELEFTKALVSIGKKLVRLSSRELKSKSCKFDIKIQDQVTGNKFNNKWLINGIQMNPMYFFAHIDWH